MRIFYLKPVKDKILDIIKPTEKYDNNTLGSEGSNLIHFWSANNLNRILRIPKNALGYLNIMLLGIH